ncbi:PKD domain-containing protein [Candidatus Gracilibacteria bacterium]|nr:PKD domain-containing protein [Candidatus Gracilibacteria bacterium]
MSAPFDPSKLNLDINSSDTPNNTTAKEAPSVKAPEDNKSSEDILNTVEVKPENKIATKQPVEEKEGENKNVTKNETPPTPIEEITEIKANTEMQQNPVKAIEEDTSEDSADTDNLIPEEKAPEKKLIDINIASLDNIITLIDEKSYDYVIVEPEDAQVKITFKQDNIDRDVRYIKFPVYTSILFKLKQTAKLILEDTGSTQEGQGSLKVGAKTFKLAAKTAPGQNGEKIWLKVKEDMSVKGKKQVKKTSLGMIFGFLGAILFISLVLGGAFIAFIVLNAKTIEDVKFFASLGINLNDINTFISQVVTLIFSILLFISTAALSWGLFKFLLTKKVYKRKKVTYGLLSGVLLLLTFGVGSAWMVIDGKIKNLPNWQEQAYGDLKIFDNDLLISQNFDENQALLTQTENLIGPVSLKFDLTNFQTNQGKKGLNITKYIWDFGDETVETFSPNITKVFSDKGNYEISVTSIGTDIEGEEVQQVLSNIPAISISHSVSVQETLTSNGGKKLSFDANDLKSLGKVEWYFLQAETESNPNPTYPEWTRIDDGYDFVPGKIFFEEIFVGLAIINGSTVDAKIDKVIVISPDGVSDISGEISYEQSIDEELLFTFTVDNPATGFANGFIESYEWKIENKTYGKTAELGNTDTAPIVEHQFENYGEQEIEVLLTDSLGKTQALKKTIVIQKQVELVSPLVISDNNGNEIEDVRYESKAHEYYLDGLGIPTVLQIDARYVRPKNNIYSLREVSWDIGDDGDIDSTGKNYNFEVPTEGNHILVANYVFEHRKDNENIIQLKEYIFVEGIKKEAILDLQLEYDSNYAPVTVRFDASKSFIKNDDIIKFIYDYGDGVSEERDSINQGHKYVEAGDYTVSLTVIGKTGKTYSMSKKLILLPAPQEVQISTSLKKAPIGQGIDFSSAGSAGQIVEYFWDFGDGNISTDANPSHSYDKTGNFTVTLRADFANKNSISDEVEIEIFEEK